MLKVYVLSGQELGASHALGEGDELGRAPGCAVRLGDASISRRHARLERDGERWVLVDLQSRNGLFQGGERVERVVLVDHDEVRLGEVQLRFRLEAPAPGVAAPAPIPAGKPPARDPGSEASGAPDEEIGLELEEEIDLEALAPSPRAAAPAGPAPGPAPGSAPGSGGDRRERAGLVSPRGRSSALTDALEDRPLWITLLLFALVLALSGGIAFGMFRLVVSARGG